MEKSKFKCVVVNTEPHDSPQAGYYQDIILGEVILQICNDNTMAMNVIKEKTLNSNFDIVILDL